MELGPRDRLSQAFVKEVEKGRTIETPYGPVVHLDLRHLGEKVIDTKIPFVRELCLKYQNIDPVTELIPVRPVVHYMMGGVHTDINGATPLGGLYAAGEVACVSINGANRLGSNSLPELLVFGARAGRAAAEYASRQNGHGAHCGASRRRHETNGRGSHGEFARQRRERLSASRPSATRCRRRWRTSAGIYRSGDALAARGGDVARAAGALCAISPSRITARRSTPNASRRSSCRSCSTSPRRSSIRRCAARSRAARTSALDFPARDDERFLAHSLIHRKRRRRRAASSICR